MVAAGLLVQTLSTSAAEFFLDDGSVNTFGGTPGGDCLSLNHFNTGGATVVINTIRVLWNPISASVFPAVTLYSDPNGDGNPSDMVPIRITPISVPPNVVILNNTTLQDYAITPTQITGSFFVGEFLSDRTSDFDPVTGIDTAHLAPGQSWIIENSVAGRMNLQSPIGTSTLVTPLDTYVSGNFMIRAVYTVVPEPRTSALMVVGILFGVAVSRSFLCPHKSASS